MLLAAALLLSGGAGVAQEAAPVRDGPAERFAEMDGNGNGRIESAEWERAIAARPAAPRGERATPAPDAPLPLPAARRLEALRDLFTRIDTDGDGGLTLDEVRAFGRALGAERGG